jgi:hypothetical protein
MIRGEEPTQTYNRLKTLVNKIRSYGSTRWTDHDVVRLMLRSFTVIDPHLVNLICENPRYTKMTPEEILGKFMSGRMMVKEARYVDDALNGPLLVHEPQTVALKATSSRETLPSKVAQVEAAGLNEDEMAFIIKRRGVNGDPIPANPWGIPLLGYGYGTKIVPMGMDMGQNLHPLGKRVWV